MTSEAANQQQLRLKASRCGIRLYRNNRGVAEDERGIPIRFGLANESKAMNKEYKSSDLIGITPYIVAPYDVGRLIGIFTSYEVKRGGWVYSGRGREPAQLKWIDLINSLGGIARFSMGEL